MASRPTPTSDSRQFFRDTCICIFTTSDDARRHSRLRRREMSGKKNCVGRRVARRVAISRRGRKGGRERRRKHDSPVGPMRRVIVFMRLLNSARRILIQATRDMKLHSRRRAASPSLSFSRLRLSLAPGAMSDKQKDVDSVSTTIDNAC